MGGGRGGRLQLLKLHIKFCMCTYSDPKKGAFEFKNLKLKKYFSNLCKLN
jgi:hypothetical protein